MIMLYETDVEGLEALLQDLVAHHHVYIQDWDSEATRLLGRLGLARRGYPPAPVALSAPLLAPPVAADPVGGLPVPPAPGEPRPGPRRA